ncbi:MAG TPA: PIN domain-containing protein [Spirochaetes bacterium]|nr:PIN domain-containing protein [Spirochaetota bacterium]
MNIVVDTSVIIAVLVNEPAKNIIVDRTKGADIFAPHSVHWEIGNAFSAMLKRNRITLEQSIKAIEIYSKIIIQFVDIDLKDSLELCNELKIYAYDAYIISCALQYQSPLITLDKGLIRSATQKGVQVLEVKI